MMENLTSKVIGRSYDDDHNDDSVVVYTQKMKNLMSSAVSAKIRPLLLLRMLTFEKTTLMLDFEKS